MTHADEAHPPGVRLDKWMWAARLCKTRSLAADEIQHGRVSINGQVAKPSRELRAGDLLEWRRPGSTLALWVRGTSSSRGPAPVARLLYEETPESLEAARQRAQARAQGIEPAASLEHGRPTGRDRRRLAEWQRWSASLDDD